MSKNDMRLSAIFNRLILLALCLFSLTAEARKSPAGEWELAEQPGGSVVGTLIIYRDGSINFMGSIGTWTQYPGRIMARVKGEQGTPKSRIPMMDLDLRLNADSMDVRLFDIETKAYSTFKARQLSEEPEKLVTPSEPGPAVAAREAPGPARKMTPTDAGLTPEERERIMAILCARSFLGSCNFQGSLGKR
jgi:hypothetical protein